ncbi:MAG TPA: hypothetical protein VMF58_18025 [Rhizomicrobium sp.]|nr:hypothetical protein [Rhizomicrobium sp.]
MFALSYCGLATLPEGRTDEWLVDYLATSHAGQKNFKELFEELRAALVSKFGPLGPHRRVTLALAGFVRGKSFFAHISNFEDPLGNRLSEIDDTFPTGIFLKNEHPMRKAGIGVYGADAALRKFIEGGALRKIAAQLGEVPQDKAIALVAQIFRTASDDESFGKLIGRDLMTVVGDPKAGFLANYLTDGDRKISYMPHLISPQAAFKSITLKIGDW